MKNNVSNFVNSESFFDSTQRYADEEFENFMKICNSDISIEDIELISQPDTPA